MLMFLCSRVSEHFTLSFLFAPRREITRATSPRSEWTTNPSLPKSETLESIYPYKKAHHFAKIYGAKSVCV